MSHHWADHFAWCRTLGDFAVQYALAGYPVLPLARGAKRPHKVLGHEGGVRHGSADPAQARAWWDAAPYANVAVACGGAQRLVVLDLDRKGGKDGPAELHGLLSRMYPGRLPLPLTAFSSTPSGGRHLWLRWPLEGAVPNRTGVLPGVDVKGDGGYVLAPPSALVMPRLEPGQESTERIVPYTWDMSCPCQLTGMPPELALYLREKPGSAEPEYQAQAGDGSASAIPPAEAARTYLPGSRNSNLSRRAAGLFRLHGTDQRGLAMVTADIRQVWEQMDNSGFPWQEAVVLIAHARRYIERQQARERAELEAAQPWVASISRQGRR